MGIIELKDIHLTLENKVIFNGFNLKIEDCDKVQIMGKSGNGKSTLLKILLGFTQINKGEVYVGDKKINDKDFKDIRNRFCYVNQDVTLRKGTVKNVLKEISLFHYNNFNGIIDEKIAHYLEFDMTLLDKETYELSGGERQRLGIIIAIMLNRDIYLLDEVTSALDQELKKKVVNYFSNVNKTVIVISHDTEWQEVGCFRKVVL